MSRLVCFIDDKDGQVATCLAECKNPDQTSFCCETCEFNPFPGKIVPKDRVLRKLTFDPLV
jgi:hypothetical protein